jgi:D-threo-aldose 1-dehydrogenase
MTFGRDARDVGVDAQRGDGVRPTAEEIANRRRTARHELRGGKKAIAGDDAERLSALSATADQAHERSRRSVCWSMDDGLDDTIRSGRSQPASQWRMQMPFDPRGRRPIGRTGLSATALGFGGASIGGLYRPFAEADARATVERAWDLGVRLFDTAPLYGYGASERRVGAVLRERRRDDFVLSTKVGRLVYAAGAVPAGADVDRQVLDGLADGAYADIEDRRIVFDYSADGIRRSIEDSLERLGLDRIDIALIHDPDTHWEAAIGQAFPALARLRDQGVIRAIGAGMNQAPMLARFAREGDFDVFLCASRYTILDQTALDELIPACTERGASLLVGGVMNTGLLADPRPGTRYDYGEAPPAMIERARRIAAICERHGVPLKAAAIQFPLAHPIVASVVAGVRSVAHLDDYPEMLAVPIPSDLWTELKAEGVIREEAPTPA